MDIARLTLSADVAEVVACECAMLAQSKGATELGPVVSDRQS
jgi:hypothetical protein